MRKARAGPSTRWPSARSCTSSVRFPSARFLLDKAYRTSRLFAWVLSRRSKYGLKALLALAVEAGRGPVLVADLSVRDAIPKKFLEAILLDLKRHGVVLSKKGKGGGYFLRRSPEEITFGEVVRALEGPLALVPCVSQTAYSRCVECVDEPTCGVRLAMQQVRDATAAILDNTTLADINRRTAASGGSRVARDRARKRLKGSRTTHR
jgi:Rrf2 family protein